MTIKRKLNNGNDLQDWKTEHQAVTGVIFYCRESGYFSVSASNKLSCNLTCQCSELNGIFNPKQDFEVEKNKIEFAKKANDPNREYLLDLRLKIMKEIDPFTSRGSSIQLHHIEHNRSIMENYSEKKQELAYRFVPSNRQKGINK